MGSKFQKHIKLTFPCWKGWSCFWYLWEVGKIKNASYPRTRGSTYPFPIFVSENRSGKYFYNDNKCPYMETRVEWLTLENKMKARVINKTYINYYFKHSRKEMKKKKKKLTQKCIYFCMKKQIKINCFNIKIWQQKCEWQHHWSTV